jgi:predicted nucleic acid-binding Zn finger protein
MKGEKYQIVVGNLSSPSFLSALTLTGISQKAHGEILKQVKDIHRVDLHLELEEEDVQRVVRESKEKENVKGL